MVAAAVGMAAVGVVLALALLLLSGAIQVPVEAKVLGRMPALEPHAWLGVIPVVVGVLFWWLVRRGRRDEAVTAFGAGAVLFLGLVADRVTTAMDEYKVPKHFAEENGLRQNGPGDPHRVVRLAAGQHGVLRPAGRSPRCTTRRAVDQFLSLPRPAYVIVPEDVWEQVLSTGRG